MCSFLAVLPSACAVVQVGFGYPLSTPAVHLGLGHVRSACLAGPPIAPAAPLPVRADHRLAFARATPTSSPAACPARAPPLSSKQLGSIAATVLRRSANSISFAKAGRSLQRAGILLALRIEAPNSVVNVCMFIPLPSLLASLGPSSPWISRFYAMLPEGLVSRWCPCARLLLLPNRKRLFLL